MKLRAPRANDPEMTPERKYEISALDLSGSRYTVEQTGQDENFRPEYEASDAAGDTLFSGVYNMYQDESEFPLVDTGGNEIATVKASGTWDVAGDYLLTDGRTGEDVVVLDNDLSLLQDTWRIRDPDDGSLLAEIDSRGALVTVGRKLLPFGQWIAHEYEITDPDGDPVGTITGEFSILDRYEIEIDDPGSVPTDPVVVGAMVIDAIQGN